MLHTKRSTIENIVEDNSELLNFLNANNVRSVFIGNFYFFCRKYCKSEEFIETYIERILPRLVEYSLANKEWKKELKTDKFYANL